MVATLFIAFHCEKDPRYENVYKIQNNSSYDLTLVTAEEEVIMERPGEYISEHSIFQVTDEYAFIRPSENMVFSNIKIYREDSNGDTFLTYEQDPIEDALWTLDTLAAYGLENPPYNIWILSITDDKLN